MACPFIQNTEGRPRRALCNQVEGNGPTVTCWWLCTSSSRPHEQGSLKGVLAECPVIAPGTGRDKDWSCCKGVSCPYLVGDCHKAISHPSPVWGRTALSILPVSQLKGNNSLLWQARTLLFCTEIWLLHGWIYYLPLRWFVPWLPRSGAVLWNLNGEHWHHVDLTFTALHITSFLPIGPCYVVPAMPVEG